MNEDTPKIKVPMRMLENILIDAEVGHFDLLVIDVEENEIEVLQGFLLSEHKPKMVIIELHETLGTLPHQKGYQEPWVSSYLVGYKKIYKDHINTIYVL